MNSIRRKYKKYKYIGLLSVVLIFTLSIIGVGYGVWNDTVEISTKITTGEFDMKLIQGNGFIERDGKRIEFNPEKIKPGDSVILDYTVRNEGTIPCKYKVIVTENNSLDIHCEEEKILEPGKEARGEIKITGSSVGQYEYTMKLQCTQVN
ncbi:MAG: CalY family protein [Anaeromicrobium sp.]|uniref:TasA family protein n=1 Tax=Anaeromicrobium sp. TaxID=1929132 RepID=UPI0025F3799D|nr:TasA family protein [Anaeromicrobium sp.]MCT4593280.1 CalY family protein [Anaeromicrobium sp.]